MPVIDRKMELGELGVLLLDGGMSVTDVRGSLEAIRDTVPDSGEIEVAVLPTTILVKDHTTGHATFVQSDGSDLSFRQATAASRLVHQVLASAVRLERLTVRINEIRGMERRHEVLAWTAGSALVSGGLAVVFRCSWWSIVAAFVVGAVVGVATDILGRSRNGSATIPFVAAFGATALVGAVSSIADVGPVPLYAVCAPIAILVPGALITNALLELTATDIVTGASRLVYGLMVLGFMSVGIVAGSKVTGLRIDYASAALVGEIRSVDGSTGWNALPPFALSWIGVAALAAGISLAFGAGARLLALSIGIMIVTFTVLTGVAELAGNVVATGFTAAVLFIAARVVESTAIAVPATVSFQPAFLLLVPGTVGLVALSSLDTGSGATIFETFVSLCLGTKIGALIAESVVQSGWYNRVLVFARAVEPANSTVEGDGSR